MNKHTHKDPTEGGYLEYDANAKVLTIRANHLVTLTVKSGEDKFAGSVAIYMGKTLICHTSGLMLAAAIRDILELVPFEETIREAE